MSDLERRRSLVGGLHRWRDPSDPQLVAARQDLAAAVLADHVKRTLADPGLSDEQRGQLAAILRGSR